MPSRGGSARRYAQAVFELAQEGGTLDAWRRDLGLMAEVFSDPTVGSYFRNPKRKAETAQTTAQGLFEGRVHPQALNLLQMLARQQRTDLLPLIQERFEALLREAQGIVIADVTTAVPVDQDEQRQIGEQLARITGKRVQLRMQVDPSIIGGLVARIGDKLIDGSVTTSLQQLRQRLP